MASIGKGCDECGGIKSPMLKFNDEGIFFPVCLVRVSFINRSVAIRV